jgi:hypothetical protein
VPVLLVVSWWYFHWVPYLIGEGHHELYFPRDLARGVRELWASGALTAEKFYFQAFRSFAAFGVFLFGLYVLLRDRRGALLRGSLLIAAVFLFFMVKAGDVFSNHGYYMVPLAPWMCAVCALGVERLPGRWPVIAITVICSEGVANQAYDLVIPEKRRYLYGVEALADRFTRRDDLVIVNGDLDPQWMYYLHRRGWSITTERCDDAAYRDSLVQRGAICLFKFGKELTNPDGLPVLYADDRVLVLDPR